MVMAEQLLVQVTGGRLLVRAMVETVYAQTVIGCYFMIEK